MFIEFTIIEFVYFQSYCIPSIPAHILGSLYFEYAFKIFLCALEGWTQFHMYLLAVTAVGLSVWLLFCTSKAVAQYEVEES